MIKVCGNILENFPAGTENILDDLLMGVVESQSMNFIKTSLNVYGRNKEEIVNYAKNIKNLDCTYDIVNIYSEAENEDDRYYITTVKI